jgi:hypothetical protein
LPLDLDKVVPQVGGMIARLKADGAERHKCLNLALDLLCRETLDLGLLREKIVASRGKTTWLVADLVDGLSQRYPPPPPPAEFTVLATDGSHIDVDRHRSTRCYLINIGSVVLHYGSVSGARLDNFPSLYSGDEELTIVATEGGRDQPVEGTLLGIKRSVDECGQLARLAAELPDGSRSLALIDGSLILWPLEPYADFVKEALLNNGFLCYLAEVKELNRGQRQVALASYISFPRSTDVVNVLRLALCPYQPADCDRYCSTGEKRACDAVAGVRDRELFSGLLEPGERSALFITPSKIVEQYYGEHRVYFCYLRVDDEIARVEIPRWVATEEKLLGLVHSLVLDQCRRGQGYPVALSEAHEQAVVTAADRENFWQLVDSLLVAEQLPSVCSAKSWSKRTRWV